MKHIALSLVASALAATAAVAVEPPKPIAPKVEAKKAPPPPEAEMLANLLRDQLGKNIPDPLTKSNQGWGNQKAVTVVHRHRDGLRFWTEPVQELRNDGVWRRVEVRIPDTSKLALAITELTYPEDGRILATIAAACDRVDMKFEQQLWRNGLRLYAGETRAHCQAGLLLKAEVTTRAEAGKSSVLPNVVLQVKAIGAELFYGELVVDHTAGLDGDAAKKVGELAVRLVKAAKPELEGDLLRKANAAIVKAAGTREVKLAFDKLLALKSKP